VVSYAITDKLGKPLGEAFSGRNLFTQLSSDAVTDVGIGLAFNLFGGRIPGSNYKVIWAAPSLKNPLPIKIVEPTIQTDIRGLRGTLADSTGGNIYNSAGGEIVIRHQNVKEPQRIKLPERAKLDTSESIDGSLNLLDSNGAKIPDLVDPSLSKLEQAYQAVNLQQMFIKSTQNAFADGNVQAAFGRFLAPKSIEQFTAESIAKGLSGDALWKDVITSASKYTSTTAFGCFAAGTMVHTDKGLVPIQDIKVGDLVLSKPESGEGETSFKPVVNTFIHENKELWLVVAKKHWNSHGINDIWIPSKEHRRIAKQSEFIATPNHPVWVVGMGVSDDKEQIESITMYPQPHWKRVDQLQQHEAIVNKDGMIFCIERAQPLYQFQNELVEDKPSYMWYQDYYSDIRSYKNVAEFKDSEEAKDYFNHDYEEYLKNEANKAEIGWVRDINNYYEIGSLGLSINDTNGIAWHRNTRKDINGLHIPFSNTVYNIEVEDDHTYFVTRAGIWVHNTNCEKAKEILLGNLKDKDGFTQVYSSKDSFSKDVTKAINEHKSIDEIKQVGITHGGTIEAGAIANWARIQQLMLGSFTHFTYQGHIASKTSAGEIWEFSISVPNPVAGSGKLNSVALGDGLITAKIDVDGNITFSNMTLDVKAGVGAYGKETGVFDYTSWKTIKDNPDLLTSKQAEIDRLNQEIATLQKKPDLTDTDIAKIAELKSQKADMGKSLDKLSEHAFDYQRQQIDNNPNLNEAQKKLMKKDIDQAEKKFFNDLDTQMVKVMPSLITTSGALEFHGSFNHAIGPSLKDLSGGILNNPAKLKAAVDDANQNAKYLADYIAYMGTRGDLVSQIGLNNKNIGLIQQAGTKWDPSTGDWLSDKIFIAKIKVVENVPIKIKQYDEVSGTVKAEKIDLQTRTDVDGFYGFVKTYDANGKLKIEVKEYTRDEVIKALDPNSTDASIKSLNETVSQINKTPAQNQLAVTVPTQQKSVSDSLDSIAKVFDQLEIFTADIRSQLDQALPLAQQAQQAIDLQHGLLVNTQQKFIDQHTQSAFAQLLPIKSLEQFTQESNVKGLTGDALWRDVIDTVVQYTNTNTFGCFAAGTLVHTEQGWTPIQEIKVGDLVLSKPENGEGDASYKPVLNTFAYENKDLWLVEVKKYWNDEDINGNIIDSSTYRYTHSLSEFIATPNHPVFVVGMGIWDGQQSLESITPYEQ
ncbi:MAG: hypothetical protein L0G96_17195, partial [Acinetobacter sp.]|nr:hypothetical protein [Acinetobacter sp.]